MLSAGNSASKNIIVAESVLYIFPFDAVTLKITTLNGLNDLGGMSYLYVEFNFRVLLLTTHG